MTFDVLIRGGAVVDGTGRTAFPADVAIEGERIAAMAGPEELAGAAAATVIDAEGKLVTPGFIDIHTHSDRSIVINPRMESKVRQGVTTEIGGNCGSGLAPARGRALAAAQKEAERDGQPGAWTTMAEYFAHVERQGIAGNYATWVGHGTLRASVVGYDMRQPTEDELAQMQALLREARAAGAFGLSTGLIYVPSGYADTDEIAALAQMVREYGGLYASHIRNEGSGLLDAVGEAIEIGQRAGVPVQVAHHKASGKQNWGLVEQSLALMDRARAGGVDVACDQYPYVASSTGLTSMLPKWALEGGREALGPRLKDPPTRAQIRAEMLEQRPDLATLESDSHWHNVLVARARNARHLEGKRLGEIAIEQDREPFDVYFDLLIEHEGNVGGVFFALCEEDVQTVMRWPHTMVGSDASSVAPYGPLGGGKPHPRAYGTFPRVLGRYVRELKVLRWEEAIHKMTAMPARRLGLRDRGELRPGACADVVVLDPATVADRATFQEPHQYPLGIEQVIVNGAVVVRDGEHTGALPGRVLRRAN